MNARGLRCPGPGSLGSHASGGTVDAAGTDEIAVMPEAEGDGAPHVLAHRA
jgi:hypothetical protein